jgi:hypothetical protein
VSEANVGVCGVSGHRRSVFGACFESARPLLLTWAADATMRLWDADNAHVRHTRQSRLYHG